MIKIKIDCQSAHKLNTPTIVAGAVNFVYLEAEFSPDWEGLGKTFIFRNGDKAIEVVSKENRVAVPHEVLCEGTLSVGVKGIQLSEDGNKVTVKATHDILSYEVIPCISEDGVSNTSNPTPDVLEQIRALYENTSNLANIPIAKGAAESSAVMCDVYANKAVSEYSVAGGCNSKAGFKGYYITAVDIPSKIIYLSETKPDKAPILDKGAVDINFKTPEYEAGDIFSVNAYWKHPLCSEIKAISNNTIIYGTQIELPDFNKADEAILWVPAKAHIGAAEFGTGAASFGEDNSAAGRSAFCAGRDNTAGGHYGFAAGRLNTVGHTCSAMGQQNSVIGEHSSGFGLKNSAGGNHHFVCGRANTVKGETNYAQGAENTVSGGIYNHAEGQKNTVNGTNHHVEGNSNKVSGSYGHHVAGYSNTAQGDVNTVSGLGNTVKGVRQHVSGQQNNVSGEIHTVMGLQNTVSGSYHTVGGHSNNVSGLNNHVFGAQNVTSANNQFVIGKYNANEPDKAFIVGGGSPSARKNIFTVDNSGNAVFAGNISSANISSLENSIKSLSDYSDTYLYTFDNYRAVEKNIHACVGATLSCSERALKVISTSADPNIIHYFPSYLDGTVYPYIKLRYRTHLYPTTATVDAKIYFANKDSSFNEGMVKWLTITDDGEWHDIIIDMSTLSSWNDSVTALRLDIPNVSQDGGIVYIKYIGLFHDESEAYSFNV